MKRTKERTAEVRSFFKEREQTDRIIREVKDQVEGRGVSAAELVDALLDNDEFWNKLKEAVLECLPKTGRTQRT